MANADSRPGLINVVNQSVLAEVKEKLVESGFVVLELDGTDVTDKQSFLARAAVELPGPEDIEMFAKNWDAFVDNLSEGLVTLGHQKGSNLVDARRQHAKWRAENLIGGGSLS